MTEKLDHKRGRGVGGGKKKHSPAANFNVKKSISAIPRGERRWEAISCKANRTRNQRF